MATKKNAKSSKTAHVLNVLANTGGENAETESAASGEPLRAARAAQEASVAAETERAEAEARIAEEIRENLAKDLGALLETEEGDSMTNEELETVDTATADLSVAEEPKPVPVPEVEEPEPAPAPEAADPGPVPVSEAGETEPVPAPAAEEPAPTPAAADPEPVPAETTPQSDAEDAEESRFAPDAKSSEMSLFLSLSPDETVGYVNVMQALVEEKAPKFLKMFEVCDCGRCSADVKALALTNLPAKYAVMEKGNVIPMLTVYEGRYTQVVTAQLMKACELVGKNPRHSD